MRRQQKRQLRLKQPYALQPKLKQLESKLRRRRKPQRKKLLRKLLRLRKRNKKQLVVDKRKRIGRRIKKANE